MNDSSASRNTDNAGRGSHHPDESVSRSSCSSTALVVPPPEHPWTGADLARALGTDTSAGHRPAPQKSHIREDSQGGTTTILPLPFTLPRSVGGGGDGGATAAAAATLSNSILSFASLFPRYLPPADTTAKSLEGATPTHKGARVTDAVVAAKAQRGTFDPVSSGSLAPADVTPPSLAERVHFTDSLNSQPGQPPLPSFPASSSAPTDASSFPLHGTGFTDLFVGLERPRLHRGPRGFPRNTHGSRHQDEGESAAQALPPLTPDAVGLTNSSFGKDVEEELAEDEEGAHTPTVYRSPQLPHWWRGVATPSSGTLVCLRPHTPHLEFWWVDRLGSEAYELMRVILRYSLEGLVVRESGEAAVVVEFRIPADYLSATSLAVYREGSSEKNERGTVKKEPKAEKKHEMGTPSPRTTPPPSSVCGSAAAVGVEVTEDEDYLEAFVEDPDVSLDSGAARTTAPASHVHGLPGNGEHDEETNTPSCLSATTVNTTSISGEVFRTHTTLASSLSFVPGLQKIAGANNLSHVEKTDADACSNTTHVPEKQTNGPQLPQLPGLIRTAHAPSDWCFVEPRQDANLFTNATGATTVFQACPPGPVDARPLASAMDSAAGSLSTQTVNEGAEHGGDAHCSHDVDDKAAVPLIGSSTTGPHHPPPPDSHMPRLPQQLDVMTGSTSSAFTLGTGASLSMVGASNSAVMMTAAAASGGKHLDPFLMEQHRHRWPSLTRVLDTSSPPQHSHSLPDTPDRLHGQARPSSNDALDKLAQQPEPSHLQHHTPSRYTADATTMTLQSPLTPEARGYSPDPASGTLGNHFGFHTNHDVSLSDMSTPETRDQQLAQRGRGCTGGRRDARGKGKVPQFPRPSTVATHRKPAGRGAPMYELPTAVFVETQATAEHQPSQQQQRGRRSAGGAERPTSPNRLHSTTTTTTSTTHSSSSHNNSTSDSNACVEVRECAPRSRTPFEEGNIDPPSPLHVEPVSMTKHDTSKQTSKGEAAVAAAVTTTANNNITAPTSATTTARSIYCDHFPRDKSYGEWLCTSDSIQQQHPCVSSNPLDAVWSHCDSNDTMRYLGKATSVTDTSDAELDEASESETTEDDSVLVRLTLPVSVCVPVVVVRLHALRLLHPLLRALHVPAALHPFDATTRSTGTNVSQPTEDADDEDGLSEALRTATRLSSFTAELTTNNTSATVTGGGVAPSTSPDYATAIRVLSDVIGRAEEAKLHTAPPPNDASVLDIHGRPETRLDATTRTSRSERDTTDASGAQQPRDLSLLYTVRSHLYFHTAAEYLYDSLKDAEAALASCPTQQHVSHAYEILMACLISFGHTAQVARVAAHLWHRCRVPTPLLIRLGRVTQVMVSYATLFLHQQLDPEALHDGTLAPAVADAPHTLRPFSLMSDDVLKSPLDGNTYRGQPITQPCRSPATPALVPLVVVGGGIVDAPPPPPQPTTTLFSSASSLRHAGTRHRTDVLGNSLNSGSGQLTTHANEVLRTLSYEVCPLLFGYYGKSLHGPRETAQVTAAAVSPPAGVPWQDADPRARPPHAHGQRHPRHRPSNDVCYRRLFLLETLSSSVMPSPSTTNRLHEVVEQRNSAIARDIRDKVHRYIAAARGRSSSTFGSPERAATNSPNPAGIKRVKPEDFIYDRDSVLALLASSTETMVSYGTVSMRYFCRHIRLSATRRIPKSDVVLMERPALLMPLWPLLVPPSKQRARRVSTSTTSGRLFSSYNTQGNESRPSSNSTSGNLAMTMTMMDDVSDSTSVHAHAPMCCGYCGRQQGFHPILCPGGCGTYYCSDRCRYTALRRYHVVECGGGLLSDSDPLESNDTDVKTAAALVQARVRRVVVALRGVFADWDAFLYDFAHWDTPSTRATVPHASCSLPPSPVAGPLRQQQSPAQQPSSSHKRGSLSGPLRRGNSSNVQSRHGSQHHLRRQSHASGASTVVPSGGTDTRKTPPPAILAVTGLRAVLRLTAMTLCLVIPVELLPLPQSSPQQRNGSSSEHVRARAKKAKAFEEVWRAEEERRTAVRAVARTLRSRGLMVPPSPNGSARATPYNTYCSSCRCPSLRISATAPPPPCGRRRTSSRAACRARQHRQANRLSPPPWPGRVHTASRHRRPDGPPLQRAPTPRGRSHTRSRGTSGTCN